MWYFQKSIKPKVIGSVLYHINTIIFPLLNHKHGQSNLPKLLKIPVIFHSTKAQPGSHRFHENWNQVRETRNQRRQSNTWQVWERGNWRTEAVLESGSAQLGSSGSSFFSRAMGRLSAESHSCSVLSRSYSWSLFRKNKALSATYKIKIRV